MQLHFNHNKRVAQLGVLLLGAFIVLIYGSCAKDYENIPLGQQATLDRTFDTHDSSGINAIRFLNEVYNNALMNGHNRLGGDYIDAASDDAVSSIAGLSSVETIQSGAYTPTNLTPDDIWTRSYATIRSATVFIIYIDRVPLLEELPDGRPARSAYKAEARFLRAWTYFELIRRYGGVPILEDKAYQLTDNIELPRSNFEDCINYITQQLDMAADSLRPQEMINSTSYGRITKGAAMALKAKVLLYAASPLFNGGNIDPSNPLTGYTSFDKQRWKLAADAAGKVRELGTYGLDSDFESVFTTQEAPIGSNTENIFWRQNGNNTDVEKANAPIGYTTAGGNGRTSPTQNLVDAFPMKNGLPITNALSGYNESDPYVNRDPRLKSTVFYNGQRWLNRDVELYDGGIDRPGGTVQQTKTGYYLRKFMGSFENVPGGLYGNTIHDWIFIRYGGILLDYAEATNEFEGPTDEVYQVLYDLRKRAGIEPGDDGHYGIKSGMDQVAMRTAIRGERRVEMAFEEQRYWDIRRWKIAKDVYAAPLIGMDIQMTGSGQLFYNRVDIFSPVFTDPKMYLYPIPYDEVVKNEQMQQNPGWK